jgi:hypothetical protein
LSKAQDNLIRYDLFFAYKNGTTSRLGSLTCDNPASPYGRSDRSIKRKAMKLAKELTASNDDLVCSVIEYKEACNVQNTHEKDH